MMAFQKDLPENQVAAYKTDEPFYPETTPFHPDTDYPEYMHDATAGERNPVYEAVRECFSLSNLDEKNQGAEDWNPLGDLLEPDDTVVLKPNFIKEDHPRDPDGWQYVLTHGSVIRAVADYVFLALGKEGKVIITDAPQTDSSFATIANRVGASDVRDFFVERGRDCMLVDMRQTEWKSEDGVVLDRYDLDGDPYGYTEFDLANASEFTSHEGTGNYYGADYDTEQVNHHHTGGRHEYLIATTPIHADVFFNLPKMKTHKKAGVTLSLKNLVGINGDKNYLPHHTKASEDHPGDEHPNPDVTHKIERRLVSIAQSFMTSFPSIGPRIFHLLKPVGEHIFGETEEVVRSGNWWGNDTVWRMCLDLNKLLLYGGTDGRLRSQNLDERKRHYSLCDGIIAGEGRGPMNPDPVKAGVVVFGIHPAPADLVTSWLMGFDPEKIPIVRGAFDRMAYPLIDTDPADIVVRSNCEAWDRSYQSIPASDTLDFEPHFGWEGHIEQGSTDSQRGDAAQSKRKQVTTQD